jgi:hypothetical protein
MSHSDDHCPHCHRPLAHPLSRVAALVRRRPFTFGALALVLTGAFVTERVRAGRYDEWDTRSKGDFELLVFAHRQGRAVPLNRFDRVVRPGDRVRFVITGAPEEHPYLLVASVDGAGAPAVYFPYAGDRSAPLPGPGRWEVPGSIVLDGTLGPERVFVLFSRTPLAAPAVRAALTRLGQSGTPAGKNAIRDAQTIDLPGTVQRSFLLLKQARS